MKVLDQRIELQAKNNAADWQRYRELLERGDAPKPGDSEALNVLAARLELKSSEIIEGHGNVIREVRNLDRAAVELPAAQAARIAAERADNAARENVERVMQESQAAAQAANAALMIAMSREMSLNNSVTRAEALRAEHWRLFDLPADPRAPKPAIVQASNESLASAGIHASNLQDDRSWGDKLSEGLRVHELNHFIQRDPEGVTREQCAEFLKTRRAYVTPPPRDDITVDPDAQDAVTLDLVWKAHSRAMKSPPPAEGGGWITLPPNVRVGA